MVLLRAFGLNDDIAWAHQPYVHERILFAVIEWYAAAVFYVTNKKGLFFKTGMRAGGLADTIFHRMANTDMSKIVEDPKPYDAEEAAAMAALDAAFDAGTVTSGLTDARRAALQEIARNTLNPARKAVSVRFAEDDLRKLKAKAMERGVPYQTLLNSLVHQFVEGRLVERTEE